MLLQVLELAKDEQLAVRKTALASLQRMLPSVPDDLQTQMVHPFLRKLFLNASADPEAASKLGLEKFLVNFIQVCHSPMPYLQHPLQDPPSWVLSCLLALAGYGGCLL